MFLECWWKQRTCLDTMLLLVVLHVSNILKRHCVILTHAESHDD